MAAHPFGPIEKFLITSCKPLKNDPRDAKLVFGDKQCFECPSVEDNLFWGFCQPRLVLEPTANVNSSEYTVQTALKVTEEEACGGMYSLSRGLGYRITFTMPADRALTLDTIKPWPVMKIEILDLFGEKILANFKNDPEKQTNPSIQQSDYSQVQELFQKAKKIYGSMTTLTMEMTSLGMKVLKDSEVVIDVPLNTGILPDDPKLRVFGIIYIRLLTESDEALDWLFARLEGFAYYFNKHHSTVTKDQLLRATPAFMGLLKQLSTVWNHLRPRLQKDEQKNPILKLKEDLHSWMGGDSSYPNYFDWKFVMELKKTFEMRGKRYGYSNKPIPIVNISCWSPDLLQIIKNTLKTPDLEIVDLVNSSRKYVTKDFTILEYRTQHQNQPVLFGGASSYICEKILFFETKHPYSSPKDAFLGWTSQVGFSNNEQFEIEFVVPDLNLIIGRLCSRTQRKDYPHCWRVVDLEKAQTVHNSNSTISPYADIKIGFQEGYQARQGEEVEPLNSFGCPTGLFISNTKKIEFYSYDALFSRKAGEEYVRIPIKLCLPESGTIIDDLVIKESKNRGEFFIMAMTTLQVQGQRGFFQSRVGPGVFSFFRMKLSADKSKMTITARYHHRFEERLQSPKMLWTETKTGHMLGCIETTASEGDSQMLLVFAVVYVNRKLVPLGLKRKTHLGMTIFSLKDEVLIRFFSTSPRKGRREWASGARHYGAGGQNLHLLLLLMDPPTWTNDGAEIMTIRRLKLTN